MAQDRRHWHIAAAAAFCAALLAGLSASAHAAKPELRLAIATSLQASKLGDTLFPAFEKDSGLALKLHVVGSGTALRMARVGEVDATITHAPTDEKAFVDQGLAASTRHVMTNYFVLLGPAADPARVQDSADILAAIAQVLAARARFISRGDDSGTHQFERNLWKQAGLDPLGKPGYEELGMGMAETLAGASAREAYVLADRGSWLALQDKLRLKVLVSGDDRLLNHYVAIAVKGSANVEAAKALVAWLGSPRARRVIADAKVNGQPLFNLPAAISR